MHLPFRCQGMRRPPVRQCFSQHLCPTDTDADGSGDVDFDEFRSWFLDQKLGTSSKHGQVVADRARLRFHSAGLPRHWSGPAWYAVRPTPSPAH